MRIPAVKKKHHDVSWWVLWPIISYVCFGLVGSLGINIYVALALSLGYHSTRDPLEFQLRKTPSELILTDLVSTIFWVYLVISFLSIFYELDWNNTENMTLLFGSRSQLFERDWMRDIWTMTDDRPINAEHVTMQQAGDNRPIDAERRVMQQAGDHGPVDAERRVVQQAGDDRPLDAERQVMQLYGAITRSATPPTHPPFIEPLDFGGPSQPLIPMETRILLDMERINNTSPHSLFNPPSLPIDGTEQYSQGLSHAITFGPKHDEKQLHYEDSKKDNNLHPITLVQGHDTSSSRHSVNTDTHPTPNPLADGEDETSSVLDGNSPTSDHSSLYEEATSSVHDGDPPASDHPSLYEEETFTSGAPVTVRIVKEQLFQEAVRWKHNKSVNLIKKLIRYDKDDDDRIPDLKAQDFSIQRRRYEKYMRKKKRVLPRPFHVYGTEELYDLDRLRLWARLGRNTNPETPFPPGYVPISDASDLASFAGTLYTQETSTAE